MIKSCKKHPKYKGKKIPKYECVDCLSLYSSITINKPRVPLKPTRVIKSKKIYSRKVRDYEE
jgi:hypothetical protein